MARPLCAHNPAPRTMTTPETWAPQVQLLLRTVGGMGTAFMAQRAALGLLRPCAETGGEANPAIPASFRQALLCVGRRRELIK